LPFLLLVLYRKSRKMDVDLSFLMVALLIIISGNVISFLPAVLGYYSWTVIGIGFIFLYFHYSSLIVARPNIWLTVLIFSLFAFSYGINIILTQYITIENPSVSYNITNPSLTTNFVERMAFLFSNYTAGLLNVVIFGYSFLVTWKVHKRVRGHKTLVDLLAQVILTIFATFIFIRFLFVEVIILLSAIGLVCSSVGIFLLIILYVQYPDYIYLLPFPIHSFMVYNQSGLLCYSRTLVRNPGELQDVDILISGALTAISSLIKETLGQGAQIRMINADQYKIYFKQLQKESGTLAVIAFGETGFFEKSLDRFVKRLDPAMLEKINANIVNSNELEGKIDSAIKSCFPYAEFLPTAR